MIKITQRGDLKKTTKFLHRIGALDVVGVLNRYGKYGVEKLQAATPIDSGKTADSWSYEIVQTKSGFELVFNNTNINQHVNIAVILRTGHGTRAGTWVEGREYISPVLYPVFDAIADTIWEEVTHA